MKRKYIHIDSDPIPPIEVILTSPLPAAKISEVSFVFEDFTQVLAI